VDKTVQGKNIFD